ncbi:hypothetical protein MKZ38_001338 [Zalerion maritima]|uniref:C3H1-type domain-containing protein n=1 Tax=Zalerion maritima TaxID=339359 RepID=A0AAD5RFC8_9PEZI|nr:hypothetical protein MKZ38_001338 [Zalerion maritima]
MLAHPPHGLSSTKMPANQNGESFRHTRSSSLNIPPTNGQPPPMPGAAGAARFDGPRSPPTCVTEREELLIVLPTHSPDTSHVPCKFFRQGGCQAGKTCPFSHDLGASAENICKYFAKVSVDHDICQSAAICRNLPCRWGANPQKSNAGKLGNCKFGPKCANIHVLPDGRRINYGKNGVTFGNPLGGMPRTPYAPSTSNLTNSFLSGTEVATYGPNTPGYGGFTHRPSDENMRSLGRQPSLDNGIPILETTHTYSHNGSAYGSPHDTDNRLEMGLSPVNKGLSVMDAPLPASFDSNGMSHVARYPNGPFPSSVPNQFGVGSPSPSLNYAKESRTSETLKMLHTSAFGNDHLSPNAAGAPGSSPPSNDELRRPTALHSSSNRYSRSRISASVPKGVDRDWDNAFPFAEEDYVPENLKDLLTPTEKARRGSLRADDSETVPAGMYSSSHTGKFGSPIPAASPSSRWGHGHVGWGGDTDEKNGRPRYGASPFGHVGSPLRNSSLIGSDLNSTAAGSSRPRPNGPPSRRGTGSDESLSALTQQMQRTKIGEDSPSSGSSPRLRGMNGNGGRPVGTERDHHNVERHVSNSSISSSRLAPRPIDEEEEGEFVFDMDEDDVSRNGARKSGGSNGFSGWTYAGATSGGRVNGHIGSSREPGVIGR